nr:coenzyme F420-0:L-glutamate ligase [Knoellia sp. DB2414S]
MTVTGVEGIPEVREGDDVVALLLEGCTRTGIELADGDIVVISSKIVSKSLGLWADSADKAAVVEGETVRVVAERVAGDRLTRIVRARSGPVMAAAGVDASNTGGVDRLLLLPRDPDGEADRLRTDLLAATGLRRIGVVVSDTAGRPWRAGQTDFALGASGVAVVDDLRGGVDADGAPLNVTTRALGDELAAAAELVKGKTAHVPAAVVRGTGWALEDAGPGARALIRVGREDWFDYGRAEAVRASLGVEPGALHGAAWLTPSVAPEDVRVRVERALAIASMDPAVGGGGGDASEPGVLEVSADTAYQVGLLAARVAAALWGEGFSATIATKPFVGEAGDHRARLTYTARQLPTQMEDR